MEKIIEGHYSTDLLNKNDPEELRKVQQFRYKFLCKDYNDSLTEDGIDDDGRDLNSDILVVKDTDKDLIVGTYRITTPRTNVEKKPYIVERQYDISDLVNSDAMFACVSRLCIDPDYRDGAVIKLLLKGLFRYIAESQCQYVLGLCSFHGTDKSRYSNVFPYLYREHRETEHDFKAIMNPIRLDDYPEEIDETKIRDELPGILRMYLAIGHTVCSTASVDKEFNCIDVLIVLNCSKVNQRYLNFMLR